MKNELKLMVGVVGVGMVLGVYSALGQERQVPAAPTPPPADERPRGEWKKTEQIDLVDITLTGKIAKEEKDGRGGVMVTVYTLTDASGAKIILPEARTNAKRNRTATPGADAPAPAPEVPVVKIEDCVGKDVTITGKGSIAERKGVQTTHLAQITSIQISAMPPAAQ